MGKIDCCYKCERRTLHCHEICEDYINQRNRLDEENVETYRQKKRAKHVLTSSHDRNLRRKENRRK